MSISTFSELQDAVANWLARDEFGDGGSSEARGKEFVALAEAEFNRTLRTQDMEVRSTASISSEYAALPSDFLEMRAIWIDDTQLYELEYMPPAHLVAVRGADETNRPKVYTIEGDQLRFKPDPDKSYTVVIEYYEKIPALTDSNTTNWLLTAHPDVYLFGALLQSAGYIQTIDDAIVAKWFQGYQRAIKAIERAERRRKFPMGGGMQARVDVGIL